MTRTLDDLERKHFTPEEIAEIRRDAQVECRASPATRSVVWRVTFEVLEEVADDMSEESVRFYLNENHCIDNAVMTLAADLREGVCRNCWRAKGEYVREATPEDLEHLRRERSDRITEAIWNEKGTP